MEETTEWRVTYQPPAGRAVTRTGTEAQVRKMASMYPDPVIETRVTLVGEWGPADDA